MTEFKTKEKENQIIVPIPPRHIVEKYVYWIFSVSRAQMKVLVSGCVIALVGFSFASGKPFPLSLMGFAGAAVCAYFYYKYAWTHEKLQRTTINLRYWWYKRKGLMNISYTDTYEKIKTLFPYQVKNIKNGIIEFGGNKFGVILVVKPWKMSPEDMGQHLGNLMHIINSLPPEIMMKVRARTQVTTKNVLQQMVFQQLQNTKLNKEQKALLFSLYDKAKQNADPAKWTYSIFLGLDSKPEEVETYISTILPGIVRVLENSRILCVHLKDPVMILEYYSSDMTIYDSKDDEKLPLLLPKKTLWNHQLSMMLPGNVEFEKTCIRLNNETYASCVLVGLPENLVSGYPENLKPDVMTRIFELSEKKHGKSHIISIDDAILPIDSGAAVDAIKAVITTIEINQKSMSTSSNIRQLDNSKGKYQVLMDRLQDGTTRLNEFCKIITVYSDSVDELRAGVSKVQAILRAYDIKSRPAYGIQKEVLKATRYFPIFDQELSTWLETAAIVRVLGLTNGYISSMNENGEGVYLGDDAATHQEYIFDLHAMGAMHAIILGATRSGKTTAMATWGLRLVNAGFKVIYTTIKPDATTNYLNAARYLKDRGEVMFLGRGNKNINPLEIMFDPTKLFDPKSVFFQHLTIVKHFINLLAGGDLNSLQMEYIERTLLRLYKKCGVDPVSPDTWKPAAQPTLIDLQKQWEADTQTSNPYQLTAQAVYSRTTSIAHNWDFLSTPTTISLTADYLVIDLHGLPHDLIDPMNYFLTAIFGLRFRTNIEKKTIIMIDEGRSFLKGGLGEEIIRIATQGGSQGVGVWIGTQNPNDLESISKEMKNNAVMFVVFKRNIDVHPVMDFFKWGASEEAYLTVPGKPGQCLIAMKEPYSRRYQMQVELSEKEKEILFGISERAPDNICHSPELERFALLHGVFSANWLRGNHGKLKEKMKSEFVQRAFGKGKVWMYIDPEIMKDGHIKNQTPDHYLTVTQIAGDLIKTGHNCVVNHFEDVDIVVDLPDGKLAIEYQTSVEGGNKPDRIMQKWKSGNDRYGRVIFVGDQQSTKELRQIIKTDGIVYNRGMELEKYFNEVLKINISSENDNSV
jgi:hypothetical protein